MSIHEHQSPGAGGNSGNPQRGHAAISDPVCGMNVDPATSKHRAEHDGKSYHFCSARCHDQFIADPAHSLAAKPETGPATVPAGPLFTYTKNPQNRQDNPIPSPLSAMAADTRRE